MPVPWSLSSVVPARIVVPLGKVCYNETLPGTLLLVCALWGRRNSRRPARMSRGNLRPDASTLAKAVQMSECAGKGLRSPETLASMDRFVDEQSHLLRETADLIHELHDSVFWLSLAICGSCEAIRILARGALFNDAVMLFRALVERTINACYLLVCDEEEVRRFETYTRQKAYRRLDRECDTGREAIRVRYGGLVEPSAIPGLQEALGEFTSQRGREINRWSKTDLIDRVAIISERSKVKTVLLLICLVMYYEDASEALHGTKYGCTFHLGVWEPGTVVTSYEDLFDHFRAGSAVMLFLAGAAVHELIRLASTLVEMQHVLDRSTSSADAATHVLNKAIDEEKAAPRRRAEAKGGWWAGWRKDQEPK